MSLTFVNNSNSAGDFCWYYIPIIHYDYIYISYSIILCIYINVHQHIAMLYSNCLIIHYTCHTMYIYIYTHALFLLHATGPYYSSVRIQWETQGLEISGQDMHFQRSSETGMIIPFGDILLYHILILQYKSHWNPNYSSHCISYIYIYHKQWVLQWPCNLNPNCAIYHL